DVADLARRHPVHAAAWGTALLLAAAAQGWPYVVVCLVLTAVVGAVDRSVGLSDGVLWLLLLTGCLHLAGGLVPVGPGVLYDAWLLPRVLRFDQAVHAVGSAAGTWASWQLLGTWLDLSRAPARVQGWLAALAGLGKGALNEAFEFLARLQGTGVSFDGVGTGWDLVFDVAGCAACAVFLVQSRADRRPAVPAHLG
ncbi:MAG: putative rane protein, partial [Frankiales bacterium]|nr:putative rane protein [Frankiales bacterium]